MKLVLTTVPHSGTRWMDANMHQSGILLEFHHFNYKEINPDDLNFTLLRSPERIVESWYKRGHSISTIKSHLPMYFKPQEKFIEEGYPYFCVEKYGVLSEISKWLSSVGYIEEGKKVINSRRYETKGPLQDELPQELVEFGERIYEQYPYFKVLQV